MLDSSKYLLHRTAPMVRRFSVLRIGYKIFDRYQECGIQGLTDRSRRPYRYANQLPFQVQNYILNVKHEHPSPGGPQNQRTSDPQTVDGPCAHR